MYHEKCRVFVLINKQAHYLTKMESDTIDDEESNFGVYFQKRWQLGYHCLQRENIRIQSPENLHNFEKRVYCIYQ